MVSAQRAAKYYEKRKKEPEQLTLMIAEEPDSPDKRKGGEPLLNMSFFRLAPSESPEDTQGRSGLRDPEANRIIT